MKKKGFTLIELLVVVAIIGVLATVVLGALGDARAKARDAKRQSDIKTIQNALELYYTDNGSYPVRSWTSSNSQAQWDAFGLQLGLNLPVDSINTATNANGSILSVYSGNYAYSYYANAYGCPGQWYMLVSRREGDPTPKSPGIKSCTSTFNYNGTVTVGMNNNE